jgi:hypothetical protein
MKAKLKVFNIENFNDYEIVRMEPVADLDPDSINYSPTGDTPSGNFVLSITNRKYMNKFRIGKEYCIDFSEV